MNALAFRVETGIPVEGDLGVGGYVQVGLGLGTFIEGKILGLHFWQAVTHLQLTAFGAVWRIGSDGEMDGFVVAKDHPLLGIVRQGVAMIGGQVIGMVTVVAIGVGLRKMRVREL